MTGGAHRLWSRGRSLRVLLCVGAIYGPVSPVNAQTRWALGVDPILSVSEFANADGTDVALFQVADAIMLPGGGVAVANGGDAVVYVLDRDGRALWQSGGSGEGPGEFIAVSWIQQVPGRLAAYDPVLRRLTWFDSVTGAVLGDTSFLEPTVTNGAPPEPIGLLADGAIVTGSRLFPAGPVEGLFRPDVILERIADGGAIRDSLAAFLGDEFLIVRGVVTPPPYQRFTRFALFEDRLAVATGESLSVSVLDTEASSRDLYTDETWTPLVGESITSYDVVTRDTYSGVVGVEYDDTGRLWVSSPARKESGELGYDWRVLDSALKNVGTLTVGGDIEILSILGDRVVLVRRDELDIEHIEIYVVTAEP